MPVRIFHEVLNFSVNLRQSQIKNWAGTKACPYVKSSIFNFQSHQNVAQTFSLWGVRRKLKVYATGAKLLSNSRYITQRQNFA